MIEIKGIVNSIAKDILDTPYVTLTNGEQYSLESVQCMFTKEQESELAKITKGQTVSLEGTVKGKLMNVLVNDCKIVVTK
jgi:aspartyl/asparaginyl-tRNA synthetase